MVWNVRSVVQRFRTEPGTIVRSVDWDYFPVITKGLICCLTRERLCYDIAVNPKNNHDPITHGTLSSDVQVPCQYSNCRSLFLEFLREENYGPEVCFRLLLFGRQRQIGVVQNLGGRPAGARWRQWSRRVAGGSACAPRAACRARLYGAVYYFIYYYSDLYSHIKQHQPEKVLKY